MVYIFRFCSALVLFLLVKRRVLSGHFQPLSIWEILIAYCNFPNFQVSILRFRSVLLEMFVNRKYVGFEVVMSYTLH